jgi:hypothetical protein
MNTVMARRSARPAANRENPDDRREARMNVAFIDWVFPYRRGPDDLRLPCVQRGEDIPA